jgi:hypothetical protein
MQSQKWFLGLVEMVFAGAHALPLLHFAATNNYLQKRVICLLL